MSMYRTRRVVVEAEQYVPGRARPQGTYVRRGVVWIPLQDQDYQLRPGDWIVRRTIKGVTVTTIMSAPEFESMYKKVNN